MDFKIIIFFTSQVLIKEVAGHFRTSAEILRYEIHWVEVLEKRRLVLDTILKECDC